MSNEKLRFRSPSSSRIEMFSWRLISVWGLLLVCTIATELLPRSPSWVPGVFYPYTAMKAIMFILLGFGSPLAFWRFNSLGLGTAFAVGTAAAVEGLQSFLVGHHPNFFEFWRSSSFFCSALCRPWCHLVSPVFVIEQSSFFCSALCRPW